MRSYLVERHLPGFDARQLRAAAGRAKATAAEMTEEGKPVRYLRSTFIPGEDKCYCLFEAASEAQVREANTRALLPVERILEVALVSAEEV